MLWCIDLFTRFVQGRLIPNKKADTIVIAVNDCWNMAFGFPVIGYIADNETEFKNVQMDDLVSKSGFSIQYGPAYCPLSNGLN